MIELGRIGIITKLSLLSSHIALSRERHLEAAVHVMAHVGLCPEIDHSVFKECEWSEFYRDAKKAIPMNAPEPQGKEVDMCTLWIVIIQGTKCLAGQEVVS